MSMFYCSKCDDLCDADDGCEETDDGLGLICIDCMAEAEAADDASEIAAFSVTPQAQVVGGE